MFVIPAVDIWEDKAVKYDRAKGEPERVYGSALATVRRWIDAGATSIHLVDLDGALGRRDNFWVMDDAMRTASLAGMIVQVGGGFRDEARIAQYLEPQPIAERVVVSTRAVEEPDWLERIARRWPGRIMLALDSFGERLAVRGWTAESDVTVQQMIERTRDLPLAAYMYTDLNVEGRGAGVQWEPIERVLSLVDRPVVFSGGITSLDEVKRFRDLGAYGVILGTALYRGTIDLAEAIRAAE
jgi:phosphoribosylformimino-5-aminoimidazole carboxamide ribotide isomerase